VFCERYGAHPHLPSFPTRRSSDLYAAFLRDAVELALSLAWERVSVIHPAGDAAALRALLPENVALVEQPAPGLANALAHAFAHRSEEHTSELQSQSNLVCRLLLEK